MLIYPAPYSISANYPSLPYLSLYLPLYLCLRTPAGNNKRHNIYKNYYLQRNSSPAVSTYYTPANAPNFTTSRYKTNFFSLLFYANP